MRRAPYGRIALLKCDLEHFDERRQWPDSRWWFRLGLLERDYPSDPSVARLRLAAQLQVSHWHTLPRPRGTVVQGSLKSHEEYTLPVNCRCTTDTGGTMNTYRDALERRLEIISDQLAALDSLPHEPEVVGDPLVITWQMRFANDRSLSPKTYDYAALKCAANGLWYTTGPASPKGYTWEELTKWMLLDNHVVEGVWFATEWEELT